VLCAGARWLVVPLAGSRWRDTQCSACGSLRDLPLGPACCYMRVVGRELARRVDLG
jgi:hypothetical protein